MNTSLASSLPSALDGGGKLSSTSLQYWGQVSKWHFWRQSECTSGGKARSQIPPFRSEERLTSRESSLASYTPCLVAQQAYVQKCCRNHCKLFWDRRWGKQWVHSRSTATPNQRDRRRNKHGPAANRMRRRLITRHFTCTTDPVAVHARSPTSFHLSLQAGSA